MPRPRRRAERVFLTLTTAVLLVGLAGAAWIAVRGAMAYAHLAALRDAVSEVGPTLGEDPGTTDVLDRAADDVSAAYELTSDPVWAAAGSLPWIGPQLTAVSRVAAASDKAWRALEPLRTVTDSLSSGSLRSSDGGYDVALLASWEPSARAATSALTDATSELSSIDLHDVAAPLAEQVTRVRDFVAAARDRADALHRTTRLLPDMLGADGPRSYLVVFQNAAEWRSLGGVVGAVAQVDADHGRLSLTAQASSPDFRDAGGDPVADLPDGLRALFDDRPARYVQNVTQVPDFARGAPLAREMWRRQHGSQVDGVIAVDPVALSYFLVATGPVTLPSGDVLTSDNAVPLLLDEVYRRFSDPKLQDAYFQSASAAVFQALAAGQGDPRELVDALGRAGAERRLLVWSADPEEEAVLDGTTLHGGLPDAGTGRTTFGIYLNDGTGAKMDYYMHVEVDTAWCADSTAGLRISLRNDAPDPATLPDYVTGAGAYGIPVGQTLTGVYVYLPAHATIQDQQVAGTAASSGFAGGQDDGRDVLKWSVRLAPGQSTTLDLRVATASTPVIEARTTPTLYGIETLTSGGACADGG